MNIGNLIGLAALLQQAIKHFLSSKKAFYSLNGIGHRHDADTEQYKVTSLNIGESGSDLWFEAEFLQNGVPTKLWAQQPALGFGKRATKTEVKLNDVDQAKPNFIISHREGVEGPEVYERALAIFEYDDTAGARMVYRFDIDIATYP